MTTHVGADEAARLLGVSKPTLYAYVSRGRLDRRTAVDGRTSLYDRAQVEQLAARSRRRDRGERASIDVRVASAVTELHDDGVTYRGHDVVALAAGHSYEAVAELLWTGGLPSTPPVWTIDRELLDRCRTLVDAAAPADPLTLLTLSASVPSGLDGSGADTARRLLAVVPSLLGGPLHGDVAERLTKAWVRRPSPALVAAVTRALVLLADHELATSTLAVRVACSVRTSAAAAIATGLHVVSGRLHGGASTLAAQLFDHAAAEGAQPAIGRYLDARQRLPGFGHTIYRGGDPRFAPLLETVRRLPDPSGRLAVVDAVLADAGRRLGHLPNIDFSLGALLFVGDLPRDAPLFAVARIAGWGAHFDEEATERPVRYRGLATAR